MYSKTTWKDRVVDPDTGAVVQEGTFMSAEHFNNMENGIAANDSAISTINGDIDDIEETLDTGVGTTISLTINQSTFVMKLALKNSEGTTLSEQSIDLPIESMVVNAEYVEATKSLVLTLQSGSTVTVPLSALINGLVNDTRKVAGIDLKDDITVSEMKTALGVDVLEQNKVDKTTVSAEGIAETTATITVPEKAKAVSVCTMKGKTRRGNLLNISKNIVVDSANYFIPVGTELNLTSGKQYTISLEITGMSDSSGGFNVVFSTSDDSQKITFTGSGNGYKSNTFTATANTTIVRGYINTSATIKNLQVLEGDAVNSYIPYGTLANAANESVVSINSKYNLLNDYQKKWLNDNESVWNNNHTVVYIRHEDSVNVLSKTSSGYIQTSIGKNSSITSASYSSTTQWCIDRYENDNDENNVYVFSRNGYINVPFYLSVAEIPISLTSLADYGCSVPRGDGTGTIYNWIDFENGLYYHNVDYVELSDYEWTYRSSDGLIYTNLSGFVKAATDTTLGNILVSSYGTTTRATVFTNKDNFAIPSTGSICIASSVYTSAATFRNAMKGVYAVYERATPEVIDISDIIRPLKVESGGTVTFVNPHNIDCDTVVKYKKEV